MAMLRPVLLSTALLAAVIINVTVGELIAYYPLNSNPSDQSGNSRDGEDGGSVTYDSSLGTSVCGNSGFFNGASKITVADFQNHDWGDEFSVSVWFKRTGQFGNYQGIVNNGYHSTGSWEIRMGRESGGTFLGGGVVTSGSSVTWDYRGLVASVHQWHHVVMTYDGSTLRYYLDGAPQSGNSGCCSGPILTRNNVVTIGQAGVGKRNEYFVGYIDEVKIYSNALTPEEVSQLYHSPCQLAYYPLDEDSSDRSGNCRDGANTGTVTYSTGTNNAICGNSRFFDGNSKITVASFQQFAWWRQFTVSVWFKRTGEFGNYQGIVNNGYYSRGSWEIRMGREGGGTMLGGGVVTSNSPQTWDYVHRSAHTNQWHHVAMTYDGSTLKYYLDGAPQSGNSGCCSGPILTRNNVVTIGQAGVGKHNEYFYGYIDEVKLYAKALTITEVNELYLYPC